MRLRARWRLLAIDGDIHKTCKLAVASSSSAMVIGEKVENKTTIHQFKKSNKKKSEKLKNK